jgi:hypothetical protein
MGDEKRMRNWLRGMPVVRGYNPKCLTFQAKTLYMQKEAFLHHITEV